MSETLQRQLDRFATNFRKQADYDYISARANFRMGLRQQFLWAGLQAVEKYLKAILLFNGKSARFPNFPPTKEKTEKGMGHDLEALNAAVHQISHLNYSIEECNLKFLSYLSKQGENRYLSIDAYNTMSAIHDLDNLVWDIRRYCQYTQNHFDGLREAQISEINRDFYKQNKHKFRIHHDGELEEIITKGKPSDLKKREALLWANLCYGTKKCKTVTHNTFSSIEPGLQWTTEIDDYVFVSKVHRQLTCVE
ncbi:MAG: HEPN domain-containing protein [Methylococcales bacterium]|nr:HEPN domain-containing protein [Methylococcales bacterium]